MPLLGWPLLVLLAILTVLIPVITALLWNRLRRAGWRRRLARASLLVASQIVAVLLVAAAINNYGFFYGSWKGLFGGVTQDAGISTSGPTIHAHARNNSNPASAGRIVTSPDPRFAPPSQRTSKGQLDHLTLTGASSQLSSSGYIYFPPQYFQRAYARHRFPGAVVMTGYPGNPKNLAFQLRYQNVLLTEMAHHRARPMVFVMLRSSVAYPRDDECTNIPGGPQALTYFTQDIPSQVALRYRVYPTGWGAIGDSTGGYCAVKIAMNQPATYYAAVALSGYYHALHDQTTGNLWGGSEVLRNLNNPEWRLKHMPAPPVSLLLTSGTDERGPDGITDTKRFLRLVKPPLSVDKIILPHGGHNFQAWHAELPHAMSWLSGHLHQRSR